MSTLKTTNLQNADASSANIILGQGSGGGATISGVTTSSTLRVTTGIVTSLTSNQVKIGTETVGHAHADNLTIADSSICGMTIRSGTTSTGNIFFSDATSGDAEFAGAVEYDHSSNSLRLHTSEAERFRIASGGDVTITNGNLVIGTAGKGIDFSATTNTSATGASMTSELLDDYEEGTFALAATSDATMTSSNGVYTKVGRIVTIKFHFQINQINSGSTTHLTGLPFTALEQGYGSSGYFAGLGNFNSISPYATGNTVYFNVINTNNVFAQNPAILANSGRLDGSIVYTTS